MKTFICCCICVLALLSLSVKAQDLLVTVEGDSLNCKITNIKGNHIYFTFMYKEEIRNTLLPMDQVRNYRFKFYPESTVPAAMAKAYRGDYPKYKIGFGGGLSNRLAKVNSNTPAVMNEYIKDLKSGYNYGFDIIYYFSEGLGLGIKYVGYNSKASLEYVYITGTRETLSDDITINFAGPILSTRRLSVSKMNNFYANVGIGYMSYTDNAIAISAFTIKGYTAGMALDIGYDIGLSKKFALGLQVSAFNGVITRMEYTAGGRTQSVKLDKGNYEGLLRVDFTVGLRIIN